MIALTVAKTLKLVVLVELHIGGIWDSLNQSVRGNLL